MKNLITVITRPVRADVNPSCRALTSIEGSSERWGVPSQGGSRRSLRFLVMTALTLFFGGCSSAPTKPPFNFTLSQVLQKQEKRAADLKKVSGKISFRYKGGGRSFSGQGRLVIHGERRLLELRDPMGRVRYSLVVDKKGVLAYYENENKAYETEGKGRPYLQKFYGVNLTGQEFLGLLVGVLPPDWLSKAKKLDQKQVNAEIAVDENINLVFDSVSGEVEKIAWKTENGVLEASYQDFEACCRLGKEESLLGHVVDIKLPKTGEAIELEWEELNRLSTDPNPEWFLRKVPPGTKRERIS